MTEKKKGGLLNASERDGVQYRTATIPQMIMGCANNGCGICFYLMMSMATYIGVQAYGISSLAVGTIIMIMRIFDGATDALIAAAFEKMSPKLPKVRIFVVGGYLIAALGVILMYNLAAGKFTGVTGMVVFILIYVFYIMGYTINGMGGGTVGILLTNDPTQRPMLGLIQTCYSYLVPLAFNNVVTFFILPRYDNQYNAPMLAELCFWYAGLAGVFVILVCIGVKDVDNEALYSVAGVNEAADKKKSTVSFKDIAAVLTSNKETQRYFWTCISDKFAQTVSSYTVILTLMNGVLIGSYAATTMVNNFGTVISIGFLFVGATYVANYGAKKSTIVWSWVSIAIKVALMVFCIILTPSGMKQIGDPKSACLYIYAGLYMAATAVQMILTATGNTMKADVVDYELDRSGNYFPAVLSGVYNFVDKLISSVTAVLVGAAISLIGYTDTVPQKGDPATWPVLWMTLSLMCVVPIVGWIINLIAMKNYTLTKEEMIEVAKRNAAKKAAAEGKAE